MVKALASTRTSTPMLMFVHVSAPALFLTRVISILNDQLLLSGPEPPSLTAFLASLEAAAHKPGLPLLRSSVQPYALRANCPRQSPESPPIPLLSLPSPFHSLDHVDAVISSAMNTNWNHADSPSIESGARAYTYGFALSFYRELELRGTDDAQQSPGTREPMRLLRTQAHGIAMLGGPLLAPEFYADEADGSPEYARDLKTMADKLKRMGYSLDIFSAPNAASLIERLDKATPASRRFSIPRSSICSFHWNDAWMAALPAADEGMLVA
ncbi:hypothetical protein C8R44DRAFT_982389 [Mycena epipterygia]|nr:hypothetical protein C8R44DRAFT_982389 [Mycena epipterygia]